jgi:DNA-binding winged helix-turn-helix (wHTH) protein/Tol biopolymer transport system component
MSAPEPHSVAGSRREYRFGDFTLDLDSGFLRRGGEEVPMRPKPLQVLTYLVEHHGRLVTKSALIEAVWPDAAVTDNSLSRCLLEIRRALSDDSQQTIRTVARRGYIFTAPVTSPVVEFPLEPGGVRVQPDPSWKAPSPAVKETMRRYVVAPALLAMTMVAMVLLWRHRSAVRQEITYTQITNFTDSATSPALSPDGRMMAFFRSDDWFLTADQIYLKLLPNGEPVQLTHDARLKCCPAFSRDGSRVAYTVVEPGRSGWKTFTVPVLGGEPSLLLSNASGLTWLDQSRLLFSEQDGRGAHMGIVSARENRSDHRAIYFPAHQRAMAHLSYASPDRKWVLVAEMDPIWQPCRVVPMDGSSTGWQVGPKGRCMSAAWSPDGKWMYFGAEVSGGHHIWRQRFPQGESEQITSGPSQEDGIAVSRDGRSLITSVGTEQGAIWIHDSRGERLVRSQGYLEGMHVTPLSSVRFSPDGKSLFYLMRDSPSSASELWRTYLAADRSEAVLPGVSIMEYDVSSDGKEVVYSTQTSGKAPHLWLAGLDRSSPPKLITETGGAWPVFGPNGQVLFQWSDGKGNYLVRIRKDGSGQSKVVPYPIGNVQSISPDQRWIAVGLPLSDHSLGNIVAVPTMGGDSRLICPGYCAVGWSPAGNFFYIGIVQRSLHNPGKTVAIPLLPGETLPDLPTAGIRDMNDANAFRGTRIIEAWDISPGPNPSVYAFAKATVHRNLFRIPLYSE